MADIETSPAMYGIFKVSLIKLLLLPPSFILANLERISAQTFFSLGICRTSYISNFSIDSFSLGKYLYSNESLA